MKEGNPDVTKRAILTDTGRVWNETNNTTQIKSNSTTQINNNSTKRNIEFDRTASEKNKNENRVLNNIMESHTSTIDNSVDKSKTLEKKDELEEVSLDVNNDDTIKLKNPKDVYLDIYKIAKEKAKVAKKQAIKAYLEAKKIKDLYLLDSVDTSDDDSEEELELFSEN